MCCDSDESNFRRLHEDPLPPQDMVLLLTLTVVVGKWCFTVQLPM